jgi:hypothetical protein
MKKDLNIGLALGLGMLIGMTALADYRQFQVR